MTDGIQILEKPEWVTWDEIHEVLIHSHSENRSKGIIMRKPSLPGDEIRREIGEDGIMLVAFYDNKLVGTAGLLKKECKSWFHNGYYGYCCFDAVLPEYNGKGIYRELCEIRTQIAQKKGLEALYVDTHHENKHAIDVNLRNGFRRVGVRNLSDHWNVVLFKWLDGCPYSDMKCNYEFLRRKYVLLLRRFLRTLIKK